MKKALIIVLIISLSVISLSGCGYNKRIEELEQQVTKLQESLEEITSVESPMPTPELTKTPVRTTNPTQAPVTTPTRTLDPSKMADNFILPEELETLIKGTGGGYDFTIPYDVDKWYQVDDKNTFVMKFNHIAPDFPWTITSSNNVYELMILREPDYDYLVLKFIRSNTETLVVFEAINEDGVVGSSLSENPDGIYFAVAIGE